MRVRVIAAIDFGLLWQVIWVSVASSLVVTAAFALVVRESGRSAEARRNGESGAAAFHATAAAVLLIAFGAIVAFGVITLLRKD